MSNKYDGMKNADLKEYCVDEGIDVDSKNVSKPTRTEYIKSIEAFEAKLGEPEMVEEIETIVDNDDFANEVVSVKNKELNNGVQKEDKTKKVESRKEKKRKQINENMALKRVLITSNATNQTKTNGIERITWGNRLLGHNTDNVVIGKPWHVREGALRNLKAAKINQSIQDDEGNQVSWEVVPAWNIQILDPLTQKEIDKIAKRQTIRDASIDSLI